MKGARPVCVENTGSEVPCVKPRGFQQKRDQYVGGRKPSAAMRQAEREQTHT
jgi:hypothetical protein